MRGDGLPLVVGRTSMPRLDDDVEKAKAAAGRRRESLIMTQNS